MPTTEVTKDQFVWDGDRLTHQPTGARFTLGSDFVNFGQAGDVLPNGEDYERGDVLLVAKQLMDEKKRRG